MTRTTWTRSSMNISIFVFVLGRRVISPCPVTVLPSKCSTHSPFRGCREITAIENPDHPVCVADVSDDFTNAPDRIIVPIRDPAIPGTRIVSGETSVDSDSNSGAVEE